MVEFTLDGKTASAPEGELLVHAAARHGTFIPTLCHDSKLDPYGGCRMCVVDVEGAPRPLPACATRVAEGMVVSTNGPITEFQRTLTEMLLSEHLNASPGGRPNELARPRERPRRRRAADAPGREARGVRRPQPAHGLRPRRVHPLRALRALHAGGHAVLRALARGPRRARADRADVGALLARHRVRALRRLPLRLPDRRDLREVRGGHVTARAPARAGADDVHVLRRRLPDRPQPRPADEAHRQGDLEGRVPAERGQPLREGPVRLQLRASPRPADAAARPRRRRRAPSRRRGSTRSRRPPPASRRSSPSTARSRSASSRRRG